MTRELERVQIPCGEGGRLSHRTETRRQEPAQVRCNRQQHWICTQVWHQSLTCQRKRARKSATAMRWLTGDEQDTMDTTIVHVDEDMDFENLAGLDLATLKKQLRLPIRGSPKRGSDSRSGTWP